MSSTAAIPRGGPAAEQRPAPTQRRGLERVRRFLFGHDIFVSYGRADATEYAQMLADALVRRCVDAYVDQLGTPPGPMLPPLLLLRLRLSSMLVLIGSAGAAASAAVAREVDEFSRHNHRIFVVDVAGALDWEPWYRDRIMGAPARKITRVELEAGTPSEPVVEQILKNMDFARREDRLRRTMRVTLAAISLLLLVGMGAVVYARDQTGDAVRARRQATLLTDSVAELSSRARLLTDSTARLTVLGNTLSGLYKPGGRLLCWQKTW